MWEASDIMDFVRDTRRVVAYKLGTRKVYIPVVPFLVTDRDHHLSHSVPK